MSDETVAPEGQVPVQPGDQPPAPVEPVKVKPRGFIRRIGILRLVIFFFVLTLVYALPQALFQVAFVPHLPKNLIGPVALAVCVVASALAIAVYALLVGWLEKRHIIEMSLRKLPQLFGGIVLAIVMFAGVYAIYFGMGAAAWKGFNTTDYVFTFAAMALISGVCEELIFRGGVYRVVEDMFGSGVALAFSGLLFGAVHLGNPNATLLAGAAIAIEAGILLGAAYAVTRSLWLPIGIHIGWNFAEGGIFGAAVSGGKSGRGLLNMPLHGPEWLTGGGFGPEASVVVMVICTLAGIFFVYRTIKTGRWCRAGFRMMLD